MASFEERVAQLEEVKKCAHCDKELVRGMESEKRKESFNSFLSRSFCDKECKEAERKERKDLESEIKNYQVYCKRCGKKLVRKEKVANGYMEDASVFQTRKYCDVECFKGVRL